MRYMRNALLYLCALVLLLVLAVLFAPQRWVANRIESAASTFTGADLQIGSLVLKRLSWRPSAQFSDVVLLDPQNDRFAEVESLAVSIELKQLLKGTVVFNKVEVTDSTVALAVNGDGSGNWEFLAEAAPLDETEVTRQDELQQDSGQHDQSLAIPLIRELNVENFNVLFDDSNVERSADLKISASGSTVSIEDPALIDIEGVINGESVELQAELGALFPLTLPPESLELDVRAVLGGSTFSANGKLSNVTTLGDVDLDFAVNADGLQALENVTGIGLPKMPPFELQGGVIRDDNFIVLRRFDGKLGKTTLEGDVRLDPTTTPVTVFANVISSVIDFDDLAGLIGATPDNATTDEREETDKQVASDNGRLLPNGPIDLLPLTRYFNGAIDYRANSVNSEKLPINSVNLRAEVDGLKLAIAPASIDIAGGNISGSINFDIGNESPEGILELEVNRVNLRDLLESTGLDDDSFGVIGGRMKFWMSGSTVSEIATNLDGGVFMLMTQGQLDALLSEFAGLDIFESITLLINPSEELTEIRCAYLDMHATSGLIEIATLVIDTDDTVFLADGSVDLNDETLDVIVEPHPKDLSVLAARTAVNVGGTLSEPTITPGRSLPLRAVAAGALAALGAPVLAVLPFIEGGTGEDSPYCSGLITSLGEAEATAE